MTDSVAELSKQITALEQKLRSQSALLEAIVTLLSEKGLVSHEDVLVLMQKIMQEKESGSRPPINE